MPQIVSRFMPGSCFALAPAVSGRIEFACYLPLPDPAFRFDTARGVRLFCGAVIVAHATGGLVA
jgi:hypothetical protein